MSRRETKRRRARVSRPLRPVACAIATRISDSADAYNHPGHVRGADGRLVSVTGVMQPPVKAGGS